MIAVDTSFPPGAGYGEFADLMESLLSGLDFVFERVTVPDPLWQSGAGESHGARVNLIGRRQGLASGRDVCGLYYHVDTVPPGDGWTSDPLTLTPRGTRWHGRGAADMKGTIAATLSALRAAKAAELPLRFEPTLLFCTDEEGGLYPGIRYLAEQGKLLGHLLNFNGGALPRIWAGCFGSIDLLFRIHGQSAHSGDPVGGINAIEESLPLLNGLKALQRQVETRTSTMPAPPHFQGRPLQARLTIAKVTGGSKGSTVPHQVEILINRRYTPDERFEDVMAELLACADKTMSGSAVLGMEHFLVGHLAPVKDPVGPHWPRWQAALSKGFGWPLETFSTWGSSTSSDMGWVQQAGIRELLLGGLSRPENHTHAADEYTTQEDVVALAKSILLYLASDFPNPEDHRTYTP